MNTVSYKYDFMKNTYFLVFMFSINSIFCYYSAKFRTNCKIWLDKLGILRFILQCILVESECYYRKGG